MERRKFIASGIGTMAAGVSGATSISSSLSEVTAEDMNTFLLDLDDAMTRVANPAVSGKALAPFLESSSGEVSEDLIRSSMRSLLLLGNFGDLGVDGQVHPGMQERLKHSMPEVQASINGMTEFMKSLTEQDKMKIKKALNENPELGERALEALDFETKMVKVPWRRKAQIRSMGKKILTRLSQSPDMLVNEYLEKSEKLMDEDNSGSDMNAYMRRTLGEKKFNERVKQAEKAALTWKEMGIEGKTVPYDLIMQDDDNLENPYRGGKRVLGLGAITTLAGWLFIGIGSATEAGIFLWVGVVAGVTVGPILILVGLIILLVKWAIESGK